MVVPTMLVVILAVMAFMAILVTLLGIRSGGHFRRGAFNNFIKLTSVKPDTPALRAIINFDPISFGHNQLYIVAYRTIHFFLLGLNF